MERDQLLVVLLIGLIGVNISLYGKAQDIENKINNLYEIQSKISSLNSTINQLDAEIRELKLSRKSPSIVIRVDDIQDYTYREAELFLLRYNMANDMPTSLGIIAKQFGGDEELAKTVSSAVQRGSEVLVHGWEHENLTKLTSDEQMRNLLNAKEQMRVILGVNATILAPPYLAYNNDTLSAMKHAGYDVMSTDISIQQPGTVSEGVISVPSTIFMSIFANGTWQIKNLETLSNEVTLSIGKYGYAVILTHPQEFIRDGKLNNDALKVYGSVIQHLRGSYSFKTIREISKELMQP